MLKYAEPGELDVAFQALADPTRRAMVDRLALGPATVSELARPLPMSLPAVYQHLQVLQGSGLVRSEKVGRVRTCHLNVKTLQSAQAWIEQRRATWERRLDRLDAFLAALPPEQPAAGSARAPQPAPQTESATRTPRKPDRSQP